MFAEDTNLTTSADSIQKVPDAVNSDLENLGKWLNANMSKLSQMDRTCKCFTKQTFPF